MRLFFSLLISSVVITGLGWVGYSLWLQYERVSTNFNETYQDVDKLVKEKKYEEAYTQLLTLSRIAENENQWQRILKKAFWVSETSGQFAVLVSLAEKASVAYPASKLFWAFRVYAALRVQAYPMAYEWALTYLQEPVYESLKKEALLGYLWGTQGEEGFFSKLQTERDPLTFEQMGDILDSAPFYYNASLLYLQQGNLEAVRAIFDKIRDRKIYTRSFAFLGYQTQDWDWVLESLSYLEQEDPVILLLMGDVYLMKRDYQNALYVYQKLMAEESASFMMPYINSALIFLHVGKTFDALNAIESGLTYFEDESDYTRYYAMILNQLGRSSEALEVLKPWLGKDTKIDLLALGLANKDREISVRTSALWQMWYRNGESYDKDLAVTMFLEFAKANLWHDFDLLLSFLPASALKDNDIAKFRGYESFHFSRIAESQTFFFEGATHENQYQAYYNVALLYYYQNDFREALDYFDRSLGATPFIRVDRSLLTNYERYFLGSLYFFRGLSQYYMDRMGDSRRSLEEAIQYDSESAALFVAYYNLFPTQ